LKLKFKIPVQSETDLTNFKKIQMRQLGMITNCLLCDTYFVECIDTIEPTELNKNSKEDKLVTLQQKFTGKLDFQACPTCNELCHNMKFQDFQGSEKETVLSPCLPVLFIDEKEINHHKRKIKIENSKADEFEAYEENVKKEIEYKELEIDEIDDGIPIYINLNEGMKPKWTLTLGLGPQKIELDNSKSGRIYKPFLKQFGLDGVPFQNTEEYSNVDFSMMNEKILKTFQKLKKNYYQQFLDELKNIKPIYNNWDKINDKVNIALK
jgi:hypothetical protein